MDKDSEVSKINSFKIKSVKLLYFSSVPIVLCLLYLCPLFFFLEFYSCFSHLSFTLTHWSLWMINEIDEKDVLSCLISHISLPFCFVSYLGPFSSGAWESIPSHRVVWSTLVQMTSEMTIPRSRSSLSNNQDNIRQEDDDLHGAKKESFSKTSPIKPKLTTSPHSWAVNDLVSVWSRLFISSHNYSFICCHLVMSLSF